MKSKTTLLLIALLSAHPIGAIANVTLSKEKNNFVYEQDKKLLASSLQFVFRSGSLHDPKGKEGLARLSFLALLRGTKEKSRVEFISALEKLGAAAGVDTQSGRTILSLTSISDNLTEATQLIAEAILTPGLKTDDLEQLIAEETAKLSQEKSNNRALARRTYRAFLMKDTPWAHTPDGNLSSIKNITPEDVRSFLSDHIKSENLIVAAASNKAADDVKALVEKNFKALPDGSAPPLPKFNIKNPAEGISLVLVPRKGSSTTEALIGHPSMRATDPDRFALEAGMFIFGDDFTARLSEVIRKQNGWTYGAYGLYRMIEAPRKYGSAFTMYAFPQTQFTHLAVPKMIEMYHDYVKNGITAKELKYAKNSIGNSYPFEFANVDSVLNKRLYKILDGAEFPSVKELRKILSDVTQAKIKKAVQRVHTPNNLLVVLVGDPDALEKTKSALKNVKSVATVEDPMTEL